MAKEHTLGYTVTRTLTGILEPYREFESHPLRQYPLACKAFTSLV
jgi:hypothetical protein